MKLTVKCKDAFAEWFFINYQNTDIYESIHSFRSLPNSMKYGVYVDFFDSVGMSVSVTAITSRNFYYEVSKWSVKHYKSDYLDTRPEARTEAIKKANEIFNND